MDGPVVPTTPASRTSRRSPARARPRRNPADEFLEVALRSRAQLMAAHVNHLTHADLEDCFWQGTGELWEDVRDGKRFESAEHASHVLSQRFYSRIHDLRREHGSRERWFPGLSDANEELLERIANTEPGAEDHTTRALTRDLLLDVLHDLSRDERRLLVCQANGLSRAEICERLDWGVERYKSAVRRSWGKLRQLIPEAESGARCRRLELSIVAFAGDALDEAEEERVLAHLRACSLCSQQVNTLRRTARNIGLFLPTPLLAVGLLSSGLAKLTAVTIAGRARLAGVFSRAPQPDPGASSAAGGLVVGGGAVKAVAAICLTGIGAAGVCSSSLVGSVVEKPPRVAQVRSHKRVSHSARVPAHLVIVEHPAASRSPVSSQSVNVPSPGVGASRVRIKTRTRKRPSRSEFSFETGGTPSGTTQSAPTSTTPQASVARVGAAPTAAPAPAAPRPRTPAPPSGQKEFGP